MVRKKQAACGKKGPGPFCVCDPNGPKKCGLPHYPGTTCTTGSGLPGVVIKGKCTSRRIINKRLLEQKSKIKKPKACKYKAGKGKHKYPAGTGTKLHGGKTCWKGDTVLNARQLKDIKLSANHSEALEKAWIKFHAQVMGNQDRSVKSIQSWSRKAPSQSWRDLPVFGPAPDPAPVPSPVPFFPGRKPNPPPPQSPKAKIVPLNLSPEEQRERIARINAFTQGAVSEVKDEPFQSIVRATAVIANNAVKNNEWDEEDAEWLAYRIPVFALGNQSRQKAIISASKQLALASEVLNRYKF